MNIINRPKTPFNPARAIKPAPVEKHYSDWDEFALAIRMKVMAAKEGHAPKRGAGVSQAKQGPNNTDLVYSDLMENGPSQRVEIGARLPNLTGDQISSALQNLRDAGRIDVLERIDGWRAVWNVR